MKKVLAFIIDVLICGLLYAVLIFIVLILLNVFSNFLNITYSDLNATTKDILEIGYFFSKIFMLYGYFVWLPRKTGNTFAGKILRIEESLGWKSPMQYFKDTFGEN